MDEVIISLHCWQADDVGGFERPDAVLGGGGLVTTGNAPGKARTVEHLRMDIEKVMDLLPGKQRLNLHAIYGDFQGRSVDRDRIEITHFQSWIDWAEKLGIGLDFNPTCFSHPYAESGYTLSSMNEDHRKFWIEHVKRTRAIATEMGRRLGTPAGNNIWIPDGSKDTPVNRIARRALPPERVPERHRRKQTVWDWVGVDGRRVA
jgi:L-rhamnose isomerase